MPRNGEKVHRRLQGVALQLFRERGYEQTTAAAIAAGAGVTERTFYRHFRDKRETLFGGEARMRAILIEAIASAPPALGPMQTLLLALGEVEPLLEENRGFVGVRQAVIAATPALREREVSKAAGMMAEVAAALMQRGASERAAMLAAQAGMAIFEQAVRAWAAEPTRGLTTHLSEAFEDLRAVSEVGGGAEVTVIR